jgi:ATP-binding cassette subfamily B protein
MDTMRNRAQSLLSNFRQALRFVWESSPRWTLANIFLLLIQGLLPLVTLYLIKLLVDEVSVGLRQPDSDVALDGVVYLMMWMGGVALLSAVCSTLAGLVTRGQAQIVTDHMHAILHKKSVEVDLEYYENSRYYDTLHRAQQEAPHRPTAILNSLLQVGQNGVSLVAMAGLLWWFHWAVLPVLLFAAFPELLVRLRYANKFFAWQRERTPNERKAWYLNWMLTRDTHAKEVRLFDLGPRFRQWFSDIRGTLRHERLDLEKRQALGILGAQAVATLGVFGVYFFVAYRTVNGFLTLGDLVMYFQAIQRGAGFLQGFGTSLSRLYESNLFLSNLEEFLQVKSRIVVPAVPRSVPRPLETGLVFDHVTFRYPEEERVAINDMSLVVRPGEHVALVGANGAGKTTLVKLLCRLYDPTFGRITLDGVDVRECAVSGLRKEVSVIFQDFAKYFMTARENIGLGVATPHDLATVIAAAQQSGVDEVISRLPQGYDSMLGKWFEGGKELSIGEWQKVALARAFLRDSQILILDEPTSAMDAKAEADLFERFHELTRGRMAILISHRLSTVKMADRIYVIDQGRIVECGTHEELVLQNGTYADLFETQAQYYK